MTIQRARTIIEMLLNHLPNNVYYDDPTWDYAWEELSLDAQDNVQKARAMAADFLEGTALLGEDTVEREDYERLRQQLVDAHTPNQKWEEVRRALAGVYDAYYARPQLKVFLDPALERLMRAYNEWLD
jgi:hypothetical protein